MKSPGYMKDVNTRQVILIQSWSTENLQHYRHQQQAVVTEPTTVVTENVYWKVGLMRAGSFILLIALFAV